MANIITLSGSFKDVKELQIYVDAQYLALKSATDQIKKLEEEVSHLQELLTSTTTLIGNSDIEKVIKTPELIICEKQIENLQTISIQRDLTLEEVKTLDLLIKNKRLINGDPTTIDGKDKSKNKKKTYTEAELVSIAKIGENKNG